MGDGDRESKSKMKCFTKEVVVTVFNTTEKMITMRIIKVYIRFGSRYLVALE